MNTSIYYFSGTGNAKRVSEWISNITEESGFSSKLINIDELASRRSIEKPDSELIGFASPTHGFNFPPIMLNFLWHFPKARKGQKAFIVNTRAGMKMGKLFLPGLSGIAQLFAALVLILKGYAIIAMKPVDMPSNWISFHPGMRQKVVASIIEKREETTKRFARKMYSGKKNYRALFDIVQDLVIAPISLLYYAIGRFVLAKTFIASSDCIQCNLCIKNCPVNAIHYVNNRPFWSYKCESCMRCMNACPTRAIETAHGFVITLGILLDIVGIAYLNTLLNYENLLTSYLPKIAAVLSILAINSVIFFVFLLIIYRLMHFLLRFKCFEKLIIYSSFTKYKFWRRYKPKF
ncbi:MAG: EFR1 family ferrodoxin [Salinivirgaceae bacterium]|nr:EFR1 family ferrodoxin [Salinivirgaceae bacterium]